MAEMVLPGVYIEVRPEGLIVPGRVGVGTVAVVGTASRGPLREPVLLSGFTEVRERFGEPDAWQGGSADELTLVRALDLAYRHGATSVVAMRVTGKTGGGADVAQKSGRTLMSPGGECVRLRANTPGTWGDSLYVNVAALEAGDDPPFIEDEAHAGSEAPVTLARTPVLKSARTRVRHFADATGVTSSLRVIYDDTPSAPAAGEVKIDRTTGALTFGTAPDAADEITVSYVVSGTSAVKVTVEQRRGDDVLAREVFTIVDGNDLVADVTRTSALLEAVPRANASERPEVSPTGAFSAFTGGDNGAAADAADYSEGFDLLLNEDAHIMVAAGQSDSFGDDLDAHCQQASTDAVRRDRIGVIGSGPSASFDDIRGHTLASDRIVFVAPGIVVGEDTLPGAYAAAAVAGLLAGFEPEVSLTNKNLRVDGVAERYNTAQLAQLLNSRVLALELRAGIRVVRGITTSTNSAWLQITTRRIVDYAKYGVRSAAEPFIGLLNNERVRTALRTTVNSFLDGMVQDEMLVSYELAVSATREEERQGIARVTMVLRPTFSIDFIKVTMFLE
jgi:hypothetical protein